MSFQVVAGGTPTPEEVAAIAAAVEVLLQSPPTVRERSRWRWAGREWRGFAEGADSDWRRRPVTTHPSGS